jgi:hypothetical protein
MGGCHAGKLTVSNGVALSFMEMSPAEWRRRRTISVPLDVRGQIEIINVIVPLVNYDQAT